MVKVGHGQHAGAGAGENADERLMNMAELHFLLVEELQIILAQGGVAAEGRGHIVQQPRNINDDALPPELALDHRLPVTREPLVARPFRPDIVEPPGLGLKPEQFRFVVRVGEVLNLQPLVFVQRSQKPAEFILKIVQVGDGAVGEVGRFKDKTLGDVAAAPQMIEQDQIADKETVGWTFKHKSDALGNWF